MKGDIEVGGGPAFPVTIGTQVNQHLCGPGMTLRDYFAGQAMIALMSDEKWIAGMDAAAERQGLKFKDALAAHSFDLADAMIEARAKP